MNNSLNQALYTPNSKYVNLLENLDIKPDSLNGLNMISLNELNHNLALLCNRYKYNNDPLVVQSLNESAVTSLLDYIQKVSENCQKAWDNFKKAIDNEQIIEVVNKQNQVYFTSGFRMQFPRNFQAPLIKEWYKIRDSVKILPMDASSYNAAKQYMEDEEVFKSHFYRQYYDPELGEDFLPTWKKKVLIKTTGKEVIGKPEIVEYVNFLLEYNDQVNLISKDIDSINVSNRNFKNMLTAMPANESFEMIEGVNQVLNELGSRFKDAYQVQVNNQISYEKNMKKEMERQAKKEAKNDKKYIMTYYMASMDIISAKMRLCNIVKNRSIKVLKNYISLQPRMLKTDPEAAKKYAEMQARRAANPNFQIKK